VLIALPHLLCLMRSGYSSGTIVPFDSGSVLV
jgi:hypothetical protein